MAQNAYLEVNNPIRTKAIAWTVGIHIVLILLMILIRYSTPAEAAPIQELGIEVNLGTSYEGFGDDQPMDMDDPAAVAALQSVDAGFESGDFSKDFLTSDDENAPVINRTNNTATVRHTRNTNTVNRTRNADNNANSNTQQTRNPRYVYEGGDGNGGNSADENRSGSNEGNTSGDGDRGVPGGRPGADNYTGSPGPGTGGISHSLSGRDISPKRFSAEFNEGGKVVIRIKIDREGKIISKRIKSSPSSTLSRIALQKLSEAKFNASPNAAPEQFGDVTIVFKTR